MSESVQSIVAEILEKSMDELRTQQNRRLVQTDPKAPQNSPACPSFTQSNDNMRLHREYVRESGDVDMKFSEGSDVPYDWGDMLNSSASEEHRGQGDGDVSRLIDISFMPAPSKARKLGGTMEPIFDLDGTMLEIKCMVPSPGSLVGRPLPDEVFQELSQGSVFDQSTISMANNTVKTANNRTEELEILEAHLQIKNRLWEYRAVVVMLANILLWKKPWYPVASFAAVTVVFMVLSLLPLSWMSTLAISGCIYAFGDFLVQSLPTCFRDMFVWKEDMEKPMDEACVALANVQKRIDAFMYRVARLRDLMPRAFSMILAFVFLIGTFVLCKFNNLFIFYVLTLILSLVPGAIYNNLAFPAMLWSVITKVSDHSIAK